ncbi:DUF3175 domain-containing protein [Sphingopyxis sp. 113P3]|uniref:DUF3175 domain-containing protein n=1 Tax=Sphingopyxis sp. (strain 113P3) TaxID=292913 RepID=UPI0009FA76D7
MLKRKEPVQIARSFGLSAGTGARRGLQAAMQMPNFAICRAGHALAADDERLERAKGE